MAHGSKLRPLHLSCTPMTYSVYPLTRFMQIMHFFNSAVTYLSNSKNLCNITLLFYINCHDVMFLLTIICNVMNIVSQLPLKNLISSNLKLTLTTLYQETLKNGMIQKYSKPNFDHFFAMYFAKRSSYFFDISV